jgi:hypothetical protein
VEWKRGGTFVGIHGGEVKRENNWKLLRFMRNGMKRSLVRVEDVVVDWAIMGFLLRRSTVRTTRGIE